LSFHVPWEVPYNQKNLSWPLSASFIEVTYYRKSLGKIDTDIQTRRVICKVEEIF
jgi:hypothetical protein